MIRSLSIRFSDGEVLTWTPGFSLQGTLQWSRMSLQEPPAWVRLETFKCPACTLSEIDNPICPVAAVLAEFGHELANRDSFENVRVAVEEDDGREQVFREVPLQQVAGELVRLAVFQSGCPVGRRIKPAMVRLRPFPQREEILKALAIFFALRRQSGEDDGEQQRDVMAALHEVFGCLAKRLEHAGGKGDAYLNGLVIVDSLSLLFGLTAPELIQKTIDECRFW